MADLGRVGLALGGGSARGWAHIGVIRVLEEEGIEPEIICGTSMGALVGAAYATDQLDNLEEVARSMRWRDVVGFVDPTLVGGLVKAKRAFAFLHRRLEDHLIEEIEVPFAAVATDLTTGREVWLREGPMLKAVRASCALPGLVQPVWDGHRWLADGVLVNPVPASVCRSLGADTVIAVDLGRSLLGRWIKAAKAAEIDNEVNEDADSREISEEPPAEDAELTEETGEISVRRLWEAIRPKTRSVSLPSLHEVVATSLSIMQARITQSRLAGDPPEVVIAPRLVEVNMMDYHKAGSTIAAGVQAARDALAVFRNSR